MLKYFRAWRTLQTARIRHADVNGAPWRVMCSIKLGIAHFAALSSMYHQKSFNSSDAFNYYKQKWKLVSFNLDRSAVYSS